MMHENKNHLLTNLRERTNEIHSQLHTHPNLLKLISKRVTVEHYIDILQRYAELYKQLETQIIKYIENHPEITYLYKYQLIDLDLTNIKGENKCYPYHNSINPFPSIENNDRMAGILYAIEGSSLGGKIIYRNLKQALSLTPETGLAFFYGYGNNTSKIWRRTQKKIMKLANNHQQVAEGALSVFYYFESILNKEVVV